MNRSFGFALCLLSWVMTDLNVLRADDLAKVRIALDSYMHSVDSGCLMKGKLEEPLNFNHGVAQSPAYLAFAAVVSNNWRSVLDSLSCVATNDIERLLVIGTGRVFDENFYLDYFDALSTMRISNAVSVAELKWFEASSRYDQMSCIIRRYRQPNVSNLIQKLKLVLPKGDYWDDIQSGVAYTNYLDEARAGLWGSTPPE